MSTIIPNTPLQIPDLLLPKKDIDLYQWSVIACDQFTSSHSYWDSVKAIVKASPSTLSLIVPEIYFNKSNFQDRLKAVQTTSEKYIKDNILDTYYDTMLLTNRISSHKVSRKGIVLQIDLSQYSPNPLDDTPIKSTEAIIESRLPKRIEVRKHSALDSSHVLMLYEDKNNVLLPQLEAEKQELLYKTPLMLEGGEITAHTCAIQSAIHIISKFFQEQLQQNNNTMLVAGDGNHSLMSAKQAWIDAGSNMDSPTRWALVELINIYDDGLQIEPIHRVLLNTDVTLLYACLASTGTLKTTSDGTHSACIINKSNQPLYWTNTEEAKITIEVIEEILQTEENLFEDLDFIHSDKEVNELIEKDDNNVGIVFPTFDRASLFDMIKQNKLFPRKAFSLGHAEDKKYYIETCLAR